MLHAIYHTKLDSFIHEGREPVKMGEFLEVHGPPRFLFCEFTLDLGGPIVKIYDADLDHLLHCHTLRDILSSDHKKLYDYLVGIGLEHIRFVPQSEDGVLNYRNSFTLNEWD